MEVAECWLAVPMGTLATGKNMDKVVGGKDRALPGARRPLKADGGHRQTDRQTRTRLHPGCAAESRPLWAAGRTTGAAPSVSCSQRCPT